MKKLRYKPYKILCRKLLQSLDSNFNITGTPHKVKFIFAIAAIMLSILIKLVQRIFY